MNMKKIFAVLGLTFFALSASAASLALGGGEAAIIQTNVNTRVTCGSGNSSSDSDGQSQCLRENANLKVQVNQLQNDLIQCRNFSLQPKIWNCTYSCNGRSGIGSNEDKATACRAAKTDAGFDLCATQCDCVQEPK